VLVIILFFCVCQSLTKQHNVNETSTSSCGMVGHRLIMRVCVCVGGGGGKNKKFLSNRLSGVNYERWWWWCIFCVPIGTLITRYSFIYFERYNFWLQCINQKNNFRIYPTNSGPYDITRSKIGILVVSHFLFVVRVRIKCCKR